MSTVILVIISLLLGHFLADWSYSFRTRRLAQELSKYQTLPKLLTSDPAPHPIHGVQTYRVLHRPTGSSKDTVIYEGTNSDHAVKAWLTLEHNPAKYPGKHFYWDGQVRPRGYRNTVIPGEKWQR
jgi:hypothetical protein